MIFVLYVSKKEKETSEVSHNTNIYLWTTPSSLVHNNDAGGLLREMKGAGLLGAPARSRGLGDFSAGVTNNYNVRSVQTYRNERGNIV